MEGLRPCLGCGKVGVKLQRLPFVEEESWFIKCDVCLSISTLAHPLKEEAIKEWNKKWAWEEIDHLTKDLVYFRETNLSAYNALTEDQRVLRQKFEKLLNAFVKLKLEYSGSWGNLSKEDQKQKVLNEVLYDMGWK